MDLIKFYINISHCNIPSDPNQAFNLIKLAEAE
jgi:hypothetical protein